MRFLLAALLLLETHAVGAQDVSKLPAWAREAAALSQKEQPPPDADAWVLLQREEYSYEGKGQILERSFRLVKVLAERGLAEGISTTFISGKSHKLKSLRGWNLRPDGELVKLDKDDMVTLDPDGFMETTSTTVKMVGLGRLVLGSLVAFETEVRYAPFTGLEDSAEPLGANPVRRWEVIPGPGAKVSAANWKEWGLTPEVLPGGGLAANALPAYPYKEKGAPPYVRIAPRVDIRFSDPALKDTPTLESWDNYAQCSWALFKDAIRPSGQMNVAGLKPADALRKILDWMNRELIYNAVYLTPERGWVPLPCPEVVRRRNGDCKDHAACLLGEASAAGLEGFPVLCAMGELLAGPASSPGNYFNHAIAAIRLKETLGLPAEVETPRGRFLLMDTTDRYCPLGRLPSGHRGRNVLICTPQGAQWAAVPDASILTPSLRVDLEGAVDGNNGTRATIRLWETGNARNLRAAALQGGINHIKENTLRSLFDLPATGAISDLTMGDPLDLEQPFAVAFTVSRPGGCSTINGKIHLSLWGLPGPVGAIQKAGTPRVLPVEVEGSRVLDYHAAWTFPQEVRPSLPALDGETPFCDLHLKVSAQGAKATLDLELRHKTGRFDWARREEGVTAWKAYRMLLNRLGEEGPMFRLTLP